MSKWVDQYNVNYNSLQNLAKFLRALPSDVATPEIDINEEGFFDLEWYENSDNLFSVTIEEDGDLNCSGILNVISEKISVEPQEISFISNISQTDSIPEIIIYFAKQIKHQSYLEDEDVYSK